MASVSLSSSKRGSNSGNDVPKTGSDPRLMAVLIPNPALQTFQQRVVVCPPLLETTPILPGMNATLANSSGEPKIPMDPLPGLTNPAEHGPRRLTPSFFVH